MMVLFKKIASSINLDTLTIVANRLILVAWMGSRLFSVDRYIPVLKIQMEICEDRREAKIW